MDLRLNEGKVPENRNTQQLGRHASTIYRELWRNYCFDEDPYFRGYFARVAHDKARSRRMRGGSKIIGHPRLAVRLVEGLRKA